MRALYRSDQFIKLKLHSSTVPILSVLYQVDMYLVERKCPG